MNTDLLIIGGGPAGLSAAYAAASNGIKTTIIDESYSLGGQLKHQTQFFDHLPYGFAKQRGYQLCDYLIDRIRDFDITILENHTMIGSYQNGNIGVTDENHTFPLNAEKVIIAVGADEKPEVFPGWTLPGVITA